MSLLQPTKDLLVFLQKHPTVRSQIAASPNATLLYAGNFFRPIWQELEQLKLTNRDVAAKRTLPDVLAGIYTPGQPHATLLAWAKSLDSLTPWRENGYVAWRALSGIFASNAIGTVSFCVGSGITRADKVFAATEVSVLMRNPNVDGVTKDVLHYYQRCIQTGQRAINFGFVGG